MLSAVSSLSAYPSDYYKPTVAGPSPCETTERALFDELANMNTEQRSIEDHVKTARIYKSLSVRGCPANREAYRMYVISSLESARALNNINNQDNYADKKRANDMINKTVFQGF